MHIFASDNAVTISAVFYDKLRGLVVTTIRQFANK
jgi:hypothetical protein